VAVFGPQTGPIQERRQVNHAKNDHLRRHFLFPNRGRLG
jgi:hypothetical protein